MFKVLFLLVFLFSCEAKVENEYFALRVRGSGRREIDGIYLNDRTHQYIHCSGKFKMSTVYLHINGALQTRWYITSHDEESRRLYGTIQEAASSTSLQLQNWTEIASKHKLPHMALIVEIPPNACSAGNVLPLHSMLISLYNGAIPPSQCVKQLLLRHASVSVLATLCVYLETAVSVTASKGCYNALLLPDAPLSDLQTGLQYSLSDFTLPAVTTATPHTIPIIPRIILCLASDDYAEVENMNACIRTTAAIYHSYAVIRDTLDLTHIAQMDSYFSENREFPLLYNESVCLRRIVSILLGEFTRHTATTESCDMMCTTMMPEKSAVHQMLCHFTVHTFDLESAVALSSVLMNVGARKASLALVERIIASVLRINSYSVANAMDYGTEHWTIPSLLRSRDMFAGISNDPRKLLQLYMSTMMQFCAPVVTYANNASAQTSLLFNLTDGLYHFCVTNYCDLQWSDLPGAFRGAFLLAYQGKGSAARYVDWYIPQIVMRMVSPDQQVLFYPTVSRRIRVAFLSTFFFRHSVGRLLGDVIEHLDQSVFDIHIVLPKTSATEEMRTDDLHFNLTSKYPTHYITPSNYTSLPSFNIVVFGDLFMHQFTTFLSYHRFAPVQIVFWGHPYPSGSDHLFGHIDYFISSTQFLPSLAEDRSLNTYEFGEQIVLFDSMSAHFLPSSELPPSYFETREALIVWLYRHAFDINDRPLEYLMPLNDFVSLYRNSTIYTCLQSLMKLHSDFDRVLMETDQDAVILLQKSDAQFVNQLVLYQRLLYSLKKQNISQLKIVFAPQVSSSVYEQLLCAGDLTLDPFPFGGGITLSDSIRCNVPFVTSPSMQAVHGIGHGIASHFSDTMIATTSSDYVQKAVKLGGDTKICRESLRYHDCGRDRPLPQCHLQRRICSNKHAIFSTGETDVTKEWNSFLMNSHTLSV